MKKLICLLLAFMLVFSLCACGKDSTADATDDKKSDNKTEVVNGHQVGDYIILGSYEQDNNISNGKEEIEWLILDVQDGKALVISKYALDSKPFNDELKEVTWETCTLRTWLNNDFLNTAFDDNEQKRIQVVTVVAEDNHPCSTDAGNDTQDKIFLLSCSEAKDMFESTDDRVCYATEYAISNGLWADDDNSCSWDLRTPGETQVENCGVNYSGIVGEYGSDVNDDDNGIRPAMWIEIG